MLAAVVAAAAVLGQVVLDMTPCGIEGYPYRFTHVTTLNGETISAEICCNQDTVGGPGGGTCAHGGEECEVSHHYNCCGPAENAGGSEEIKHCVDLTEANCPADHDHKWCEPAPPASEKLSSGAIGGIVVGAYLGVAGAFGALAAYRGVAAV